MELNKAAGDAAAKHIERSMNEMSDAAKVARWQTPERVDEEVNEIMAPWLAAAEELLKQSGGDNGK